LSVEKLNEMRTRNEIFGYKDGTSWKFKMQEIERVADEFGWKLNLGAGGESNPSDVESELDLSQGGDDELEFDLDDSSLDLISESDSEIEVDAERVDALSELTDGGDSHFASVRAGKNDDDDEFDFEFDDDDESPISAGPASKNREPLVDDEPLEGDEDLEGDEPLLVDEPDLNDDLQLHDEPLWDDEPLIDTAPASTSKEQVDRFSDEDEFQLQDDSADEFDLDVKVQRDPPQEALSFGSSDIRLAASDDDLLDDSSDLLLDDEPRRGEPSTGKLANVVDESLSEEDLFDDELSIQESHEDSAELSSDFERSSDVILEDSDSSAEVAAMGKRDDDVLLDDDESDDFELSGSGLLELSGGDEEDDELLVLDEPAAYDAATDLGDDDDFNLTPLEELVDEESSGSQVIALDDSEMYSEEMATTLLSPSDEIDAAPMLTEDAIDIGDFGAFGAGIPGMATGMPLPAGVGTLPAQPYSRLQIACLAGLCLFMAVGALVGYDLARNLWLPENQIWTGGILNLISGLFGG
jgi:hypothetical protein